MMAFRAYSRPSLFLTTESRNKGDVGEEERKRFQHLVRLFLPV